MPSAATRCLLLACGNSLRGDDGVGPWLAAWAEERFVGDPQVRIISRQQWTPELAQDIATAESVIFIDCSIESAPGSVHLVELEPAVDDLAFTTHHQDTRKLLALVRQLYNSSPPSARLLTIGAGATELTEGFSEPVRAALPEACRLLEQTILTLTNIE